MSKFIRALSQHEQLNFLLTNRIPRRFLTRFMGWFSGIESKALTSASLFIWKLFADDLDLTESRTSSFSSLRECFIRELKDGARTIDTRSNIVISPCDAIVGACGSIEGTTAFQAKGFPYELSDLIPESNLIQKYHNGVYVTLRLKSSMYHRFHAPIDGTTDAITYISGDTWNVNPIALKRIEKLYCKNERASLELNTVVDDSSVMLVAVAAILVASIKFNCIDGNLDLKYRGPNHIKCYSKFTKGDEMGYFQHGSTIILFATKNHSLCDNIVSGKRISMGEALLHQH